MKNKTLEEQAKELYPKTEVIIHGKTITEFFTVILNGNKKEHTNSFNLKRITKYDWEGNIKGIPEMKFEIDNLLMNLRIFGAMNDLILGKQKIEKEVKTRR